MENIQNLFSLCFCMSSAEIFAWRLWYFCVLPPDPLPSRFIQGLHFLDPLQNGLELEKPIV